MQVNKALYSLKLDVLPSLPPLISLPLIKIYNGEGFFVKLFQVYTHWQRFKKKKTTRFHIWFDVKKTQGKSNYCVCDHVNELFMYDQIRHPIETVCY